MDPFGPHLEASGSLVGLQLELFGLYSDPFGAPIDPEFLRDVEVTRTLSKPPQELFVHVFATFVSNSRPPEGVIPAGAREEW